MPLPAFDLIEAIQTHNTTFNTSYGPENKFNFVYFSDDTRQYIRTIEQSLVGLPIAYWFTKNEWRTYQEIKNPESCDLKIIAPFYKKVMLFRCCEKLVTLLTNSKFWELHPEFSDLKKLCEQQSEFALFSNQAMVSVINFIEKLEEYFTAASEAIIKNEKIPCLIWLQYHHYVEEYLEKIRYLKVKAIESMLFRIKLCMNAEDPTPILYIASRVQPTLRKQLTVTKPSFLTEQQYHRFKNFIEKHGSETNKLMLARYMQQHGNPDFCMVADTMVPTTFKNSIPVSLPRFSWLAPERRFRQQFFMKKDFLLAKLQRLPQLSELNYQSEEEITKHVSILQNTVQLCERHQSKMPAGFLFALFRKDTKDFIRRWNAYLGKYQKQCLVQEVMVAEQMAIVSEQIDAEKEVSCQDLERIKKIILVIENDVNKFRENFDLLHRVQNAKQKIQTAISKQELLFKSLQELADGKHLPLAEISNLGHLLNNLRLHNPTEFDRFITKKQAALVAITKIAKATIEQENFCIIRLRALQNVIFHLDPTALNHAFEKFFHRYLLVVSDEQPNKTSTYQVLFMESVLKEFANDIKIEHKSIGEYLKLIHLEKRPDTNIFMRIKAKAVLEIQASIYIRNRLQKDASTLNKEIFARVSETELGNTDYKLSIWKRIYHLLTTGQALDDIFSSLDSVSKTLIGVDNPHVAVDLENIKKLLLLSQTIYQKLELVSLNLIDGVKLQKKLQLHVDSVLSTNQLTRHKMDCFKTVKGRHTLFSKTFVGQKTLLKNENTVSVLSPISH